MRGQLLHRQGVTAVRVEQRAEVVEQACGRGDQDRGGAGVARCGNKAAQELHVVGGRIGVARGIFALGVVMAELDQQDVATLQFLCDGIQAPFGDETARAAAALGVVAHLPLRRVEPVLQLLAPACLWRALRAVVGGGGVASDEDAVWRGVGEVCKEQQHCEQQQTHGGLREKCQVHDAVPSPVGKRCPKGG